MEKRFFYLSFIWALQLLIIPAFAAEYIQTGRADAPITMNTEDTNYTNDSAGVIDISMAADGYGILFGDGDDSFTNYGKLNLPGVVPPKAVWESDVEYDLTTHNPDQRGISFGNGNNSFLNYGETNIYSGGISLDFSSSDGNNTIMNAAGGTLNMTVFGYGIIGSNTGSDQFINEGTFTLIDKGLALDGMLPKDLEDIGDMDHGINLLGGDDIFINRGEFNLSSPYYSNAPAFGGTVLHGTDSDYYDDADYYNTELRKTIIEFEDGDDKFINEGIFNATVLGGAVGWGTRDAIVDLGFGDGNNTFINAAGAIFNTLSRVGSIKGSNTGADKFINDGTVAISVKENRTNYMGISAIHLYGGDDIFINRGELSLTYGVLAGGDWGSLYLAGINLGLGDNTFINEGTMTVASKMHVGISFTSPSHTFPLRVDDGHGGEILTPIERFGDNNIFTNEAGGTITISSHKEGIGFGIGADILTNKGSMNITSISITDGGWEGHNDIGIRFDAGADILTNTGTMNITTGGLECISLGEGDDVFNNRGALTTTSYYPGVTFGAGDDNFTSDGSITSIFSIENYLSLYTGPADHNPYTHPVPYTAVDMGEGADILTINGAFNSTSAIRGGADQDILNLGGAQSLAFDGNVTGFETINKHDAGIWELTATITDTEAININDGALYLNGTIPGNVAVAASTGSLGVTSPNSLGTLTLEGDFTLGTGTLLTDLNSAEIDFLDVTGTADIDGGILLVNPIDIPSDANTQKKVIASAGGLTGNFATVNSTSPLFNFEANYTKAANEVWLDIERVDFTDVQSESSVPLTTNQLEIGDYMQGVIGAGVSSPIITALLSLSTPEAINKAINTLTAEPMASAISVSQNIVSAQQIDIFSRMGIHHRYDESQESKFAAQLMSDYYPILNSNGAPFQAPNSFWTKTIYLTAKNDPDDGKFEFETDTSGISIGRDYQFGNFMLGASGSYAKSDIEYKTVPTEADIDTLTVSLYGSYIAPTYYIDTILSYSNHDDNMDRYIPILNETAKGAYRADEYTIYINGGYPIHINDTVTVTPTASLQYSRYEQEDYIETGSSAALAVAATGSDSFVSGLGFTVEKMLDYGEWKVLPNAKLMWRREFCDSVKRVEAGFAEFDSGLGTFISEGYDPGDDAFALTLGSTVYKGEDTAFFINYDLGIKDGYTSHAVTAGLQFYF